MTVPTTGTFYIVTQGTGTSYTAEVTYGKTKPNPATLLLGDQAYGPYSSVSQVAAKLSTLNLGSQQITVYSDAGQVLGSINASSGQTSTSAGNTENTLIGGASSGSGASVSNIPGAGTIDDLINFIKQPAIWERVGEVVVGLIILYVGIKSIATPAGQQPAKRTMKDTAKKVAETAIFTPK